jgi:hypothetical protein
MSASPHVSSPSSLEDDQSQADFEDYPEFNEWLNSKYGVVRFVTRDGEYTYDAADVLFKTDRKAYFELFNTDFQNTEAISDPLAAPEYVNLRRKVCDNYPPMIAYSCNRTFDSVKYKERLERLRDVWETAVHVSHALIIGEYRFRRLKFSDAGVKLKLLFSDSINQRVENVRNMLDGATTCGARLLCHDLVPLAVLDGIAGLNSDVRNEISHVQSLSEWQAKALFAEILPKVRDVLLNLEKLEGMGVRRLLGIKASIYEMEFEEFAGHASRPQTRLVELEQAQLGQWGPALHDRNTLTEAQGKLWTLSPFIHINREDSRRHYPELWFLKRKHGEIDPANLNACTLEFEVMDSSNQETVEAERFKHDILDLHSLCQ